MIDFIKNIYSDTCDTNYFNFVNNDEINTKYKNDEINDDEYEKLYTENVFIKNHSFLLNELLPYYFDDDDVIYNLYYDITNTIY